MTLKTQSEFAKQMNFKPGYVTQLKNAGRIVMDGKFVDVEKSIELIEVTKDPSKNGVKERHSNERASKQANEHRDEQTVDYSQSSYQKARAMRESFNAALAKIEYEKTIGKLLDADQVHLVIADGDAVIRNRLESMPDVIAPQLVDQSDVEIIKSVIRSHIETVLIDLSKKLERLVK